jgi:N-acetylglutamate synthase-like GNAT family acetyltransferase
MATFIRRATVEDVQAIHRLVRELATAEKYSGELASVEFLREQFFERPCPIQILLMEVDGEVIGMAHLIETPSTYADQRQAILQDFVISADFRGCGNGRKFLIWLAKHGLEAGWRKITWGVLAWNTPAMELYKAVAEFDSEVKFCVMDSSAMARLVSNSK